MNLPEKRSLSSPLPVNKRLKLESSPRKWKAGPTPAPTFSSSNTRRQREPTRGTESVRLPSRNPSNAEVNNLILKITGELARAGKRLVHAPKLMTDGILFDWVLDFSAKEEDIGKLLSVKGIIPTVVQTVLGRAGTSPSFQNSGQEGTVTDLLSDDESGSDRKPTVKLMGPRGSDFIHPICIDVDGDDDQEESVSGPLAHDEPLGDGPLRANANDTQVAANGGLTVGSVNDHVGMNAASTWAPGSEARSSLEEPDPSSAASITPTGNSSSSAERRTVRAKSTRDPDHADDDLPDPRRRLDSLYGEFRQLMSTPDIDDEDESEEEEENTSAGPPRRGFPTLLTRALGSPTIATIGLDGGHYNSSRKHIPRPALDRIQRGSRHSRTGGSNGDEQDDGSPDSSDVQAPGPLRKMPLAPQLQNRPEKYRSHATSHSRSRTVESTPLSGEDDESSEGSTSEDSEESAPDYSSRRRPLQRPSERKRRDVQGQLRKTTYTRIAHEVNIPKTGFARGRRLLVPADKDVPLTTIAMRGDASFIDQRQLYRISRYSLPFYARDAEAVPRVTDACLLEDNTAVLGFESGPCQVSVIPPTYDDDQLPRRLNLSYRAHSTVQEKSGISYPNPGISALAPVPGPELRFLSGGHDKSIHIWTLRRNSGTFNARSHRLKITHAQRVNAVAYRAHDHKVFSAAGKLISAMNVESQSAPDPIRVSDGAIFQVHIHPNLPALVVLEVDHMDRQVLFYDTRMSGFDRPPCIELGMRAASTQKITRYTRGSACHSFFVRPYGEGEGGLVRMWDYRNARAVVARFHSVRPAPVVHAVMLNSDIYAYGRHSVTIWKTTGVAGGN